MTYKAPVRDLTFALEAAADFGRLASAFPAAAAEHTAAGECCLCRGWPYADLARGIVHSPNPADVRVVP